MRKQVSTEKAGGHRVSSLRQTMLSQMAEKGLAELTQEAYRSRSFGLVPVACFAGHSVPV